MATEAAIDTLRRIAVLISGSGTNLQTIVDACNILRLPHAQIVLVFSNRKAAHGLTRATTVNPPIPTVLLPPFRRDNLGATRVDYDLAVAREVLKVRPDVLVLAGWMDIVSEGFLERAKVRLRVTRDIAFDGANAIERGIEAFQRVCVCSFGKGDYMIYVTWGELETCETCGVVV
ncbi:formyl transferase-domain-containing protein [Boletus edulis]|nr:formyl transferase-domain-containing protein [Boletus edulis]